MIGTPDQLRALAADLGVSAPSDDGHCERLLERALGEVEVLALGTRLTTEQVEALTGDQVEALADATCRQALWQAELADEDEWLGPANLSSIEGLTFSRDTRPRLSPTVQEQLALRGLVKRSGIARPEPEPVPPDEPCWPWWGWL